MAQNNVADKIKGVYKSLVRVNMLVWIVSILMFLLLLKVVYLQVIKGSYYKELSDQNCISVIKITAPRGYIYDRNYTPLVINKTSNTFSLIPINFGQNPDRQKALNSIASIIDMTPEEINTKLTKGGTAAQYLLSPVKIKKNISERELSMLQEKKITISGIDVSQEPIRYYNQNNSASHIIGYVGEVTDEQIKFTKYNKIRSMGDMIGQTGIENYYDETLRGEDGALLILTDAHGRQKKVVATNPPKQGKNLVMTIDYRIQNFAENLLDKYQYKGVIIVQVPKTGEILAMASKPDYNLNYFSGNIDVREWKKLIRNKANPLNNRAVQGLYSPGSIFKIAVGTGALNEKIITTKDSVYCEGIYWIKTWPYKCWKRAGHGIVNFYHAIAESCDIFFYKTGLKMKVELLSKYASMFGFGEKTGIDIPGEKAGLVPSREWKQRVDRSQWFPGNTVMMSIGQGYIIGTPLQIMNLMTVMANSGYTMVPHLMKAITLQGREIDSEYKPKKLFELAVKPEVIDTMHTALKLAVMSGHGTAQKVRIPGLSIAGKTSTVQNIHGDNHAMFAGYAPVENPEIVVYVLVEFGGGGGEVAVPLAKEVFQYYFKTLRGK
ncbi:MAG: penicillin-binding protein 2 [bacterium]